MNSRLHENASVPRFPRNLESSNWGAQVSVTKLKTSDKVVSVNLQTHPFVNRSQMVVMVPTELESWSGFRFYRF